MDRLAHRVPAAPPARLAQALRRLALKPERGAPERGMPELELRRTAAQAAACCAGRDGL
jgi:hypothetical protein